MLAAVVPFPLLISLAPVVVLRHPTTLYPFFSGSIGYNSWSVSAKTASLFAAATKVGPILANQESKIKDALEFYGKNLGLTFQIADDTLDYNSELKILGKKIGNDFYEGKITLPIILLYQK